MKTSRNTTAKTTILKMITQSSVALSQIEIQNSLNDICDRVTIYRVLDRLVNEDMIHKIVTIDGTTKYASCHHSHENEHHIHNHLHFSCEKCLSVTCLDTVKPIYIIADNYLVKEVNFTLSGLCPNCLG
jgi:Fur family ferric uptake transcriptional regulator